MTTVADHYEALLAELYSWMMGDFDARIDATRAWLDQAGIAAGDGATAIDLGTGAGSEAIALARHGYRVVAVDASAKLVAEARTRVAHAGVADRVEVVEGDLVAFLDDAPPARLLTCLGDTLTHLGSVAQVQQLFAAARRRLAPGGAFALTYRDLSRPLTGLDRFFPVRADDERIFTCFVEYLPDHAMVHDLVHVRQPDGGWQLRKSAYPKLRLAADDVCGWLGTAGFAGVERVATPRGMTGLVARTMG